ncbi:MAG: TlpA disulfide reductase family protein, partial [Planctomycetota bacterium]
SSDHDECKQDIETLKRLRGKYQRYGLQVVGVNVDETRGDAEKFLKSNPTNYANLYDDGGMRGSPLAIQLGVQTLPTMLLLNQKGQVVKNNLTVSQLPGQLDQMLRR